MKRKIIKNFNSGNEPDILADPYTKDHNIANNSSNPVLSVISCSMNLGKYLEDTIISVKRQTCTNYEHIIIDGGSTDETIDILRKYKHIKWISEKDSGYVEGLLKGLAIAKGKYVMQCAVSDGYLDKEWFDKCIEVLDKDNEVSLVWGFPQYIDEQNILGGVSYPQFHNKIPPQKEKWLYYWLSTAFWLPEGNFCVRKNIFEKCFPNDINCSKEIDPYLRFNYNFNVNGYMPFHIPAIANFGRTHDNQLGQQWTREARLGRRKDGGETYFKKVEHYRWKLLAGMGTHVYRDGKHNILPVKFSNKKFRREHKVFIAGRVVALAKGRVKTFAKKYLPYPFLTNVKRIYMMVKRP